MIITGFCKISVALPQICTVYPKKYAHGFCFAVLCCGYTLTDFPISIRLTSLALWQSNDCPSASKATLMNMDKYFKWIHYERLHNHNKAKHNKTVCIFLGIYCRSLPSVRKNLNNRRRFLLLCRVAKLITASAHTDDEAKFPLFYTDTIFKTTCPNENICLFLYFISFSSWVRVQ